MLSSGDFSTEGPILLDFAYKTFRRRTTELAAAASKDIDKASKGVLLFYAAECGLKAVYMSRNSLRLTSDKNAADPPYVSSTDLNGSGSMSRLTTHLTAAVVKASGKGVNRRPRIAASAVLSFQ
jgi:hypothetical protein